MKVKLRNNNQALFPYAEVLNIFMPSIPVLSEDQDVPNYEGPLVNHLD
jgi:hypothetical protein